MRLNRLCRVLGSTRRPSTVSSTRMRIVCSSTGFCDVVCATGVFVAPPLLRGQEEDNAEHRTARVRVERAFARRKNRKILRDCRQKGDGLHRAVAAMHNLAVAG